MDALDKVIERGIAKLILTLVELIRRLMEKEAFRRVKKGSLNLGLLGIYDVRIDASGNLKDR
ncbi:MAG: gas vesicle protein GvpK [Melioribacteraceae bacterium]